jgi:hypothetical protein
MEGMSDSTRAFLKAFLFCALAAAVLTAIFSGVVPGDISKAITFGALAVHAPTRRRDATGGE